MTKSTPNWSEFTNNSNEFTIRFNWDDDHSSYRLEELQDEIAESFRLINKVGYDSNNKIPEDSIYSIYDLKDIVPLLKRAISDEKVDDKTARRMYLLGEMFDLYPDVIGDDSYMAYQDAISYTLDALRAWSETYKYSYSKENHEEDPVETFIKISENDRSGYYRLGDRWFLNITEDVIDINGQLTIKGLKDIENISSVIGDNERFDLDAYYVDSEEISDIIDYIKVWSVDKSKIIASLISSVSSEVEIPLKVSSFKSLEHLHNSLKEKDINLYLKTLSSEWALSFDELISTIEKI